MKSIIISLLLTFGSVIPSGQPTMAPTHRPVEVGPLVPKVEVIKPLAPVKFQELKPLELASLPIAPEGTYQNTYAPGNCTWYVASRIKVPETLGNANTWDDNAPAYGGHVTNQPIVGAVGQTDRGGLGHVVVVTGVHDGMVDISEMNVLGLGMVDSTTEPATDFTYIYF